MLTQFVSLDSSTILNTRQETLSISGNLPERPSVYLFGLDSVGNQLCTALMSCFACPGSIVA